MRRIALIGALLIAVAATLGITAATASAGTMQPNPVVIIDR